jgi:predicted NodU family carbamoyl transferase
LLKDDTILAAYSCERTNRMKHTQRIEQCDLDIIKRYTNTIDKLVLVNVLEHLNQTTPSINAFNVSEPVDSIKRKLRSSGIHYKNIVVDNANHHLYHAAAGFYTLGVEDAIVIIMDGFGSVQRYPDASFSETTTIFYAKDTIDTLHKNILYKSCSAIQVGWNPEKLKQKQQEYNFPVTLSSHLDIGKMYGTVTRYIGFRTVDAGKTMGLSAYGKPNNLPPMLVDDTTISNSNLFRYDSHIDTQCYPQLENPNDEIKKNMAYNVQRALEKIFAERVASALKIKYSDNVILGGGCALNILGNSVVKRHFPDINVYAEPIAADAAQSVGAALHHYKLDFPNTKFKKIDNLYFGPHYQLLTVKQRLFDLVERYNNESTLQSLSN